MTRKIPKLEEINEQSREILLKFVEHLKSDVFDWEKIDFVETRFSVAVLGEKMDVYMVDIRVYDDEAKMDMIKLAEEVLIKIVQVSNVFNIEDVAILSTFIRKIRFKNGFEWYPTLSDKYQLALVMLESKKPKWLKKEE